MESLEKNKPNSNISEENSVNSEDVSSLNSESQEENVSSEIVLPIRVDFECYIEPIQDEQNRLLKFSDTDTSESSYSSAKSQQSSPTKSFPDKTHEEYNSEELTKDVQLLNKPSATSKYTKVSKLDEKNSADSLKSKILFFTNTFLVLTGFTMITEMALAINYLVNNDIKFSALTFAFTILPSLFVGFWGGRTFFFRILFSYASTSYYGCRAKFGKNDDRRNFFFAKMKKDYTNSSAVVVLKRAIETAPQILIQLSLLLFMNVRDIDHKYTTCLQIVTIVLLTILLTATIIFWDWSLFLHEGKNEKFTIREAIFKSFSYFFIITSRMLSLSLLAFVHPKYGTNALLIHIFMTAILVYSYFEPEEPKKSEPIELEVISMPTDKTNVSLPKINSDTNLGINKLEPIKSKIYFSLLSSLVLTFLPFSFSNKKSYFILYSLFLIESVFATLLSYFTVDDLTRKNTLYVTFLILNYIAFALGTVFAWLSAKRMLGLK